MSQDVKLFHQCDHYVGGKQYAAPLCPRCLGKGYYYDISFDGSGKAITTSGTIKLQQEVLKAVNDIREDNLFFPRWGSGLHGFIGQKSSKLDRMKMGYDVRETLDYLRDLQLEAREDYRNMDDSEIIQDIEAVTVTPITTGYDVNVRFTNIESEIYGQSIEL